MSWGTLKLSCYLDLEIDEGEESVRVMQPSDSSYGDVVLSKSDAVTLAMYLLEWAGWQPMETAPRDGKAVMALRRSWFRSNPDELLVMRFNAGRDRWIISPNNEVVLSMRRFIGWQPLPVLPGVEVGDE